MKCCLLWFFCKGKDFLKFVVQLFLTFKRVFVYADFEVTIIVKCRPCG